MRRAWFAWVGIVALGCCIVSCSASEAGSDTSVGGATSSGGTTSASGGATSSGGTTSASGGSVTGGATGTGGTTSTGGVTSTGGTTSTGTGGTISSTPGDVLMSDDFEDGDDKGWIQPSDTTGNFGVVTDGAGHVYEEQTETSDAAWSVGGNIAWTDMRLDADFSFVSSSDLPTALALMAIRLSDMKSMYFLEIRGDGRIKLRVTANGSTTDLATYDPNIDFVLGEWHTIGFEAKGSAITVYEDGTPVIPAVTDTRLTHGGIALGARDAVVKFDNVKVTVP